MQDASKLSADNEYKIVRKAVIFGQELVLPKEVAFGGSDLAEMIIILFKQQHFQRLRSVF